MLVSQETICGRMEHACHMPQQALATYEARGLDCKRRPLKCQLAAAAGRLPIKARGRDAVEDSSDFSARTQTGRMKPETRREMMYQHRSDSPQDDDSEVS
jgi:hypothetical protein